MVINRGEMKRKRKDACNTFLLDETPKRTKVHAQRKFAQGSNVSSPVLTPIKELERLDKSKPEALPEPTELLPSKRPNTEDFLTFLCFRGTSILPPSLNFFNSATTVTKHVAQESKKETNKGPIATGPIDQSTERPFIAFGVRKRADPIVIGKQMDKKRRHALTLQALRRKYQEQRMAKIRAVTVSRLSEKIEKKTVVRTTRSSITTKVEVVKKKPLVEIPTKIKCDMVKMENKEGIRSKVKPKMCLRSFRGRFIQQELNFAAVKKRKLANKRMLLKKAEKEKAQKAAKDKDEDEEEVSEFSSDDDEPLVKSVDKENKKKKVSSPTAKSPKGVPDVNFRVTRSNILASKIASRRQQLTKKLLLSQTPLKGKVMISKKLLQRTTTEERSSRSKTILNNAKTLKLRESTSRIKKEVIKREDKREKSKETKKVEIITEKKHTKQTKESLKDETANKKESKAPKESLKVTENKKPDTDKTVETRQRPTRKTKEAAAIYMEILGHKLVNDENFDDDISIDSFPELPNVRKTEQREIELKAKANVVGKKSSQKGGGMETRKSSGAKTEEPSKMVTRHSEIISNKSSNSKSNNDKTKNSETKSKPVTSSQSKEIKRNEKEGTKKRSSMRRTKNEPNESSDDVSSSSSSSSVSEKKELSKGKNEKKKGNESSKCVKEHVFDDSDEEPLSKLTQKSGSKISKSGSQVDLKKSKPAINTNKAKKSEKEDLEKESIVIGKPKRECTKKPPAYQPMFSSSDDEDKFFHGFNKTKATNKNVKSNLNNTYPQSSDLLRKDLVQSFGKGKMNMSNEQIEKWLNDSALATRSIKKENDQMLKFGEKIPTETSLDTNSQDSIDTNVLKSTLLKTDESKREKETTDTSKHLDLKHDLSPPKATNDRKPIFRKVKQSVPNANAFSAANESSIYAFGEENEQMVCTPFRRLSRRPSSTATSRSEDDFSKGDEASKASTKFRVPPIKQEVKLTAKNEIPLVISAEDPNCSASIAVQVNLEPSEVLDNVNIECATQTETEENEHLFYIPLQPNKQLSSQLIQGVAVKLGTESDSGTNNPRVVMRAKLVTKALQDKESSKPEEKTQAIMFPPSHTLQKTKSFEKLSSKPSTSKASDKASEVSDDFKYKVPSSPSASSSSSANIYKKQSLKTRQRPSDYSPVSGSDFPGTRCGVFDAPVFQPSDKEFQDPLEYIEKIRSKAEKFGICRIIPPSNFKPECQVSDDMRFTAYNQYVHKMLHRWGPNFKELMAIKKYLKTQNIKMNQTPLIGGMEVDLPRLYQTVQSLGGLKEVIEKKKWSKVSEMMKIPKWAQDRVTKLDDIYCKYLLPYDTLSPAEREKLFDEVETEWAKRESKTLLKMQKNQSFSSNDSESDSDDEAEECTLKGKSMALNVFYRISRNTMSVWFKTNEPEATEVESEFWKHVIQRQNHICVHSGSIDSRWGYGFGVSKSSPFARHAWNLKVLTNNSGSVLRSMGPIMGVTVPTLHVGMVFTSCCWYRDPHCLPWIEYLHTGGNKIWYGIPDSMSEHFHSTLLKLVPNYCRNKTFWLPSDTVMVPPGYLVENGVSICRTVQEPGQFVVVFPKAFTSSVSTGYVISESVYFAPPHWLQLAQNAFKELGNNCEPTMFSLDRLILSIATDVRTNVEILKQILPMVEQICKLEKELRAKMREAGIVVSERLPLPDTTDIRKRRKVVEDDGDYECEVCRRNLFTSLLIENEENEAYCLEHGLMQLKDAKLQNKNCKLLYTYDEMQLEHLLERVKERIANKPLKRVPGKFHGMPTMLK